jgi:hypothetical protein
MLAAWPFIYPAILRLLFRILTEYPVSATSGRLERLVAVFRERTVNGVIFIFVVWVITRLIATDLAESLTVFLPWVGAGPVLGWTARVR